MARLNKPSIEVEKLMLPVSRKMHGVRGLVKALPNQEPLAVLVSPPVRKMVTTA